MTPWPLIIAAAASAAIGTAAGYRYAQAKGQAMLAACEQARVEDSAAAAAATAALMKRAEDAEGRAARSLSSAKASIDKRIQEARHDVYALAGSGCGVSGAVRLRLNTAIAGDVPAGAGHAAGAAAGAAADSGEREIAAWVLDAAQRYEECRARIEAIRQWDAATHGEER
ncbi:MAG: hypothetical protein ACK4MJ_04175 [Hylemonella sp.]